MNVTVYACSAAAIILLAGCANQPTRGSVDAAHDAMAMRISKDQATIVDTQRAQPLVTRVSGNWLGVKVKPLAQEATLPNVFKTNVTLIFPGRVNLRTVAERLTKVTGINVNLKPDVFMPISQFVGGGGGSSAVATPPLPTAGAHQMLAVSSVAPSNTADEIELNFADTQLREVLNRIGTRFGIIWAYSENDGITFSRLTTRSFNIKSSPGDTALSASLGKGGGSGGSSGVSFSSNGQVSMNSSYSVWAGLQSTIDTIKTSAGKYFVNQATGTLTITDTKEVVDIVERYVDEQNDIMSQQVAIRVEVLSVKASNNNEFGIDWSLVFSKLNGSIPQWSASLLTPSSLTSTMSGSMAMSILHPKPGSTLEKLSGSQAMINALQGIGRISDYQTFSAVTLNRQPVPLAVTSQLSYLARTTPGSNGGLGGSTLPGLEPGLLTTGFLSNILPTVLPNNKVLMQFSLDSSVLKAMGVISTGQGITQQSIQTPQVDAIQTVQRVALTSGSALVLTGFERDTKRYDQRSLTDNVALGGSFNGQSSKESVVIILTPMIVDGAGT